MHGYTTRTNSSQSNMLSTSRHRNTSQSVLHVLSISAAVTRVRWRPPTDIFEAHDRHESMLAVATAPIKGASAGGAGMLALWSWKRPYMPLSVVVGHREGAVTDFHWLDTPRKETAIIRKGSNKDLASSQRSVDAALDPSRRGRRNTMGTSRDSSPFRSRSSHGADTDSFSLDGKSQTETDMRIWQHLLSVGRDGRCLIQSLARGAYMYIFRRG